MSDGGHSMSSTLGSTPEKGLECNIRSPGGLSTVENEREKDEVPQVIATPTPETVEYPQGVKLAIILVALALSIFLASLDMVCGLLTISIYSGAIRH